MHHQHYAIHALLSFVFVLFFINHASADMIEIIRNKTCVKCYPYGVAGFCGGWVSAAGILAMHMSAPSWKKSLLVIPKNPPPAGRLKLIDAYQQNNNKCLLHAEAWDQMQNATPQMKNLDAPSNILKSEVVDSVYVIKSYHGNRGIFHSVFGIIGFVSWANLNNISLPVNNAIVLLNPSDTPDWLLPFKSMGSGKLDTKKKEIAIGVRLASSLAAEYGASMIRPLGSKYETFWTEIAGIPPWDDTIPIEFKKVYEGRSGVFTPGDFSLFRRLVMTKLNISDESCTKLPEIIIMNRAAQHGIAGRSIVNIHELQKTVENVFPKAHIFLVSEFDNLPINMQIRFATCASFIIGPHGGGLIWSVLMPPGSRLLEILPTGTNQCSKKYQSRTPMGTAITDYHRFSLGAEHHFDCVVGSTHTLINDSIPWRQKNIRVDPLEIENILRLQKIESDDRIKSIIDA